jgi:hypothetical protein
MRLAMDTLSYSTVHLFIVRTPIKVGNGLPKKQLAISKGTLLVSYCSFANCQLPIASFFQLLLKFY